MRLREYFYDKESPSDANIESAKWNRKKSRFTPQPGREKWLDTYIEVAKEDILKGLKNNVSLNISGDEHNALRELLNNDEIIIRPADKGSGIVIIDREEYVEKLENELNGNQSYEETSGDSTVKAEKEVKKVANKLCRDGFISRELKNYLIPKYPKAGKVKGNPKLHKSGNPYRMIVSGIGTSTERMAEIAEKELDQFVRATPSYIQDTTDFLNKLQNIQQPLPSGSILFCFGVVKLYPSIPRREGDLACKEALDARTDKTIGSEHVLEMIKTVLNNNNFRFNGRDYIQKEDVAIGSKLGKNYACAYMRKWDEELLKYDMKPMFYKRYIDDVFGVWTDSIESLVEFHKFANKIHPNIKVELRYNANKREFLDTMVKQENGFLKTDLYTKPTDKHLYVQAKSSHPNNVKKAIPYGLGVRLKRICTDEKDYIEHRKDLKLQLRRRGYSSRFIENQLQRVDKLNRVDLLTRKEKGVITNERVPLVVTYAAQLPDIAQVVKKNMHILYKSDRLKTVFEQPPIISYRRDRNLNEILVHGKTNKIVEKINSQACKMDCNVCKLFSKEEKVKDTTGDKEFIINVNQRCDTQDVVYGLLCKKCEQIVYVGETERRLKDRVLEHQADIRHKRNKPVSIHFTNNNHSMEDLEVKILETVRDKSKYYRQIKEVQWIDRLKTTFPYGINTKQNLGVLWKEYK